MNAHPGLWSCVWPAEDGGPARLQEAPGPAPRPTRLDRWRDAEWSMMVVQREPGELFVYRSPLGEPSCVVERIDPESLEPLASSPPLDEGGTWWPGGLLAHANGYLYVTSGRFCHKLDPDCRLVASTELPRPRPYNSLVPFPDGHLAMKDFIRDGSDVSRCVVLDPDSLGVACAEVDLPEPSIARLSADADDLYVVGESTLLRFRWTGDGLVRDAGWRVPYRSDDDPSRSYGWDAVVAGGDVWWLDQGAHDYAGTMRGAAGASGAQWLWRAAVGNQDDSDHIELFGLPDACVTNPPLVDAGRGIAVGYDSANARVAGVRNGETVWDRAIGQGAHMIQWPDEGVFVCEDYVAPGETSVVSVDIESGDEVARAPLASQMQSVVFWAPGFDADVYYVSFSGIGRLTR